MPGFIIFYVGLILFMALWIGNKQTGALAYYLGAKRLGPIFGAASLLATAMSPITYLAIPGEFLRIGPNYALGMILPWPLILIVVWFVILPKILGSKFVTVYGYLGERFDQKTRRWAVNLALVMMVGWLAVVLVSTGFAISQAVGGSPWVMLGVVGMVSVFYTVIGGFDADVLIDAVQLAVMVLGAVLVVYFIGSSTSTTPIDWFRMLGDSNAPKPQSPGNSNLAMVILNAFFWGICALGSNQVLAQRYLAARDLSGARKIALAHLLMHVGLVAFLGLVGLALFFYCSQFPESLPEGVTLAASVGLDRVFPHFIKTVLPPVLSSAVMAALLAAAMSTIDSGVNSIAATISQEWKPGGRSLDAAKRLSAVVGVGIVAIAFLILAVPKDFRVFEYSQRTFNCLTGPLGAIFLAGFLTQVRGQDIRFGVTVGLLIAVCLSFYGAIFWIIPASATGTFAVAWLSSKLRS